jgi:hypothetical protein
MQAGGSIPNLQRMPGHGSIELNATIVYWTEFADGTIKKAPE